MRSRLHATSALLGLILLLFTAGSFASGLTASLDRTRMAEGESVMLTLSAPSDLSGAPDLSPLKQDFDLLGQSQATHTRIINGQGSSSREWRVTLAPKRTGKLQLPALQWGGLSSPALSLQVLPAGQAARLGMARPVLLEVDAKPDKPYVQSKVIYTLRLLYRDQLSEASLTDPKADNALIRQLGKEKRYSAYRDGQQYQVIERRYAIFPQASGRLSIEPPLLSAQIPDTRSQNGGLRRHAFGNDPFADIDRLFGSNGFPDMDPFATRTRPIELRGRRIALDVRPEPAGAASPWLPAESLTLNEAWSPDPPRFQVGDPVTRTVAITAQGLSASQLPDLELPAATGIKAYPDKPQSDTHASGDTLVAQKTFKVALVPSQAGDYTLPEIDLKWWDITAGKAQEARIPARRITVLPAVGGSAAPSVPASGMAQSAAGGASAAPSPAPLPANTGEAETGTAKPAHILPRPLLPAAYWPWLTALFALAWLLSSMLWLRARRTRGEPAPPRETALKTPRADPAAARKRLELACRRNDARAARQTLLEWSAAQWPASPPTSLEAVAACLGSGAREIVQQLDRGLYAELPDDWDGSAAWSRLAPLLDQAAREPGKPRREPALPPLYPQGA